MVTPEEGDVAILYRLGDTARATLADVADSEAVKFGSSSTVGISDWHADITRYVPDVPEPSADAPSKPDTGLEGMRLTLNCLAHVLSPTLTAQDRMTDPVQRPESPLKTLMRWCAEQSDIPDTYDEGRYGLWFYPLDVFTLHPTRSAGYRLNHVRPSGWPNEPTAVPFDMQIEYSGLASDHPGLREGS